jgi:hypothetical protein
MIATRHENCQPSTTDSRSLAFARSAGSGHRSRANLQGKGSRLDAHWPPRIDPTVAPAAAFAWLPSDERSSKVGRPLLG